MSQREADALTIEAHITVDTDPRAAFSAFTAGLATWWPTAYSWGPETLDRHELEPRGGGRITEFSTDGFELDWGRIEEWDPPARLVFAWAIGPDRVPCPDATSRVTVQFLANGGATRVSVVHDRFEAHGDAAVDYADALRSEQGWPWILAQYAAPLAD